MKTRGHANWCQLPHDHGGDCGILGVTLTPDEQTALGHIRRRIADVSGDPSTMTDTGLLDELGEDDYYRVAADREWLDALVSRLVK